MGKIIKILTFLSFIIYFGSCEKQETESEKIEKDLKTFVKENNITKCTIEDNNNIYKEVYFSINGGFVIVKSGYAEFKFNLLCLTTYSYYESKGFFLYFTKC